MKNFTGNSWIVMMATLLPGLGVSFYLLQIQHLPIADLWPEILADWITVGVGYSLIRLTLRMYPTKVGLTGFAFVLGGVIGCIIALENVFMLRQMLALDVRLPAVWINSNISYRYLIFIAVGIVCALLLSTKRRIDELEARYRRQQDAESLLREAELLKLRQQLQPHFLFNSLNSISSLMMIAPERAQDMIGRLAHFLRLSIHRDGREAMLLEDELEYIKTYLSIETIRFGDRLQIIFEKDNPDGQRIPSHLLQPLVENAVKYGLQCEAAVVPVNILLKGTADMLTVSITNPCTSTAQPATGAGFGLEGVRRRLYLLYGRADLLETTTKDSAFTATLKIPQRNVPMPHN